MFAKLLLAASSIFYTAQTVKVLQEISLRSQGLISESCAIDSTTNLIYLQERTTSNGVVNVGGFGTVNATSLINDNAPQYQANVVSGAQSGGGTVLHNGILYVTDFVTGKLFYYNVSSNSSIDSINVASSGLNGLCQNPDDTNMFYATGMYI